jgi:hypothetical protein
VKRLAAALVVLAAAVALSGCGGGGHLTATQQCTADYQVLVTDGLYGDSPAEVRADGTSAQVQAYDTAMRVCDSLTPAQAKQAALAVHP